MGRNVRFEREIREKLRAWPIWPTLGTTEQQEAYVDWLLETAVACGIDRMPLEDDGVIEALFLATKTLGFGNESPESIGKIYREGVLPDRARRPQREQTSGPS